MLIQRGMYPHEVVTSQLMQLIKTLDNQIEDVENAIEDHLNKDKHIAELVAGIICSSTTNYWTSNVRR